MHDTGPENLSALRWKIRALQTGPSGGEVARTLMLGDAAIDGALPWGGLKRGGLHEIGGDGSAGCGFHAGLLSRAAGRDGRILWCHPVAMVRETGLPYGPGLAAFGLTAGQFLFVRAKKSVDVLWAMEEGLRSGGLAAVVGDGIAPDFTATRRLQLAAEESETPAFILLPPGSAVKAEPLSAALTRWRIHARPGRAMRWRAELRRCRGGTPGEWVVEWHEQALHFRVAEALAGRATAG